MSSHRPTAVLSAAGLTAALGVTLVALPTSAPAAASTQSAQSLVRASLAAAAKQSAVHYVVFSTAGSHSVSLTADASEAKGTQSIVVHLGKKTGHVNGRLVGGNVYFQGDEMGLTEYLGMPTTLAPKYTGKWIVFSSSDSSFSRVEGEFQLSTALSQISIKKPLSLGRQSTVNGTPAINVNGTTSSLSTTGKSGPATLSVAVGKTPLPVRFVGSGRQQLGKARGWVNFSKWNEPISVQAPSGAIPASSIKG